MERCRKRLIELSGTGKHVPQRRLKSFQTTLKPRRSKVLPLISVLTGIRRKDRETRNAGNSRKHRPHNKRRLKPFSLFQTTPYKERPFQTTLNVV